VLYAGYRPAHAGNAAQVQEVTEYCLICGAPYPENCHWPEAVGMGRNRRKVNLPVVKMCHSCHMRQHAGDEAVIEALIRKAPEYWQATGQWDKAMPYFERFMAKREYLRKVAV